MKNYEGLGNLLQSIDARDWHNVFCWEVASFPQSRLWLFSCVDWHGAILEPRVGSAPRIMAKNLTLTSMTPTIKAAALSLPYILETATLEPLKHSCKHMFCSTQVEFKAGPYWETPARSPTREACALTTLPFPLSQHRHTQHQILIVYRGLSSSPWDSMHAVSPC